MSRWTSLPTLALAATLLLAGCATTGLSDSQRLALYRAHAGAPQKDLSNADRLIGWTALGDEAVAVWTRPNEAYLLDLGNSCNGLNNATTILISNLLGQVSAGMDRVTVIDRPAGFHVSCRIQSIRRLDTQAIRASEQALREARLAEREAADAGS
ncbi:DUF6491 family protein [Pseudoxanthomonas winnipegensis]|uniref:Lipoprotein n=1 Tax=Pseudoxanthomonas winnipegensis TaxID=2480810 RepID=A0A4Q8M284_9GAMM|nr:DUF6491 family protein [Pseudoxanthomonas winnipegensis]TAA38547.1 hypothetical protein EA655_16825 [Pseudoxanthomonas winnipegensis]